jgi:hypothetical protein
MGRLIVARQFIAGDEGNAPRVPAGRLKVLIFLLFKRPAGTRGVVRLSQRFIAGLMSGVPPGQFRKFIFLKTISITKPADWSATCPACHLRAIAKQMRGGCNPLKINVFSRHVSRASFHSLGKRDTPRSTQQMVCYSVLSPFPNLAAPLR